MSAAMCNQPGQYTAKAIRTKGNSPTATRTQGN